MGRKSKLSGDFLNKENWGNISRGFVFDAAMFYPSDTQRPLEFFVPDMDNQRYGTLVNDIGDFSPKMIEGRHQAVEQKVVITLKPRKVIVVTNNDLNHNGEFEYIHVAPTMSIHPKDKDKPWYQKVIKDEHPFFVYLPENITGKEAIVDISQIISIHKSMLLRKGIEIPPDRLDLIEQTIMECLDLGLYEEEELVKESI